MFNQSPSVVIPIINGTFAGLITFFTFPFINKIALGLGLVDKPSPRKQHDSPIVRIGGITIVIGCLSVLILNNFFASFYENYFFSKNSQLNYLIFGGFIMFLLGLIDDLKGLSPWSRLVGQFLISTLLWSRGLAINEINLSTIGIDNFVIELGPILSFLITILWLVGITNAFNWIDGLDGLAIGIAGITALSYAFIFFKIQINELIVLSSIICGISIAFLKLNFFPAKIFMGDGGAYFLGFLLGAIAIFDINSNFNNPIFPSAIIILLIPLLDMTCVISRRLIKGRSPFYPDNSHFHHYLLNAGFNHKQTVLILHSLTAILAFVGCSLINFKLIIIQ